MAIDTAQIREYEEEIGAQKLERSDNGQFFLSQVIKTDARRIKIRISSLGSSQEWLHQTLDVWPKHQGFQTLPGDYQVQPGLTTWGRRAALGHVQNRVPHRPCSEGDRHSRLAGTFRPRLGVRYRPGSWSPPSTAWWRRYRGGSTGRS